MGKKLWKQLEEARKKYDETSEERAKEDREKIQSAFSKKGMSFDYYNNSKNNESNNMPLPVRNNKVQNYNTTNTFPTANNLNRNNIGREQKSISQKVFEALNPGKKISYTNKNESKFDNNFLTKQALPLVSDVGTTVASILKSNNINNNLNNNKFVSDLDKTIKTGFLSGIGSFESGMINAGALPIGEAQKALGKITGIKSLEDRGNISESIGKAINNASQYGSRTNSMIDNDFVKTAGQVSEGIGNMAVPIAVNVATGGEGGNLLQAISAGGNKAISTLNEENSNPIRSALSGGAMGGIEYYTNKLFGGNILAKGSLDDIAGNAIKKIPNKVGQFLANKGYAVGGEIIEENLSNIGEYIVDKIINNKDMPSLKQWFEDSKETTKTTFLTTIVLDMLGFGGADLTQNTEQDTEMNKKINEAEQVVKQNIEQDIQKIDNQDIEKNNAKQDITERINNSNLSQEDKTNMLDYVQNENFTQSDYNAMRDAIENNQEINKQKNAEFQSKNAEIINNEYVTKEFKEGLEKFNSKKYNQTDHIKVLNELPQYFYNYGYEINQPLYLNMNKLEDIMKEPKGTFKGVNQHGITMDIIEDLPRALNNPLNIIKNPKYNNRFIVVTDLTDQYGDIVVVPITLKNGNNAEITSVSKINSIYGKDTYDLPKNDENKSYIENNKNNIIYDIDNERSSNSNYRLQLPSETTTASNNSITNSNEKVNTNTNYTQNTENNTQNTKGESINWNEIERPEGKFRKHYQSIIKSSNTTAQAKAVARELMEADTDIPESNKNQLQRADERIQTNGADKELTTLSTNVDNGSKITSVDIAVGERLIEYYSKIGNKAKLQEAIQTTAMAGTQAGQTVQALALLNHQTPQGQVTWIQRSVDKLNKELKHKKGDKAKQFEFTPEMQQKILNAKDKQEMNNVIDEVYQELGQQVPKSFIEKLDSWRYFSMLANPRTHIRNIVGNFAMGKMQGVKNKVAGAIEDTMSLVDKDMERTHTLKRASKETKQFAKNDLNNVDIQTRLELNENKYNPKSRIENSQRTFKSDVLEKTIGKAFNFNDTALEAEDGFGLKHAYVKALSEYMTANKLTPETITEKQLAKARNHAIEEAKEATFHSKNAIATAINQFSRKNKLTKYTTDAILPFVKTPLNVAKAGLEYNPTGLIKTLTVDSVKLRKGKISINKYIDNLSKGLTGTGLAVLGYAMAKAGILKASGGDDDKKEKYDEALGRQAYSLEINGKTFSLDWLAPAGIPLFVGAEAQNIKSQGENEKKSISSDDDSKSKKIIESLENWANAMSNSISPMSEMSMISGLTSALKSYDNDSQKMLGTIGTNSLKSYVNQFVPTALGQLARTTDEYERNTTSTKTGVLSKPIDQVKLQVMSKVPGLRQKLPTKSDIWGNEVKQQANIPFRAFNNFVNPSIIKDVSINEVDNELNSLYSKTRESSIIPKSIDKTFTIDGTNYRMTNEEYAKYNKKYGETSYNLIKGLVTSNVYKNLTDEQKQKAIESVYSYAKEQNKVDYAKENNKEIKQSTLYETMKALESKGGNQSNYLEFISKTSGADIKERQKVNTLYNADYDKNTKDIIYSNTIGKDDETYNKVKKDNISINSYLKYKDAVYNETDKKRNSGELGKEQNLKSVDKIKILLNSNFSENEKKSLYSNAVADDDVYSKLLKENINVDEYLNFKKAQLNEKLASDKDKYGQAIRGTSKEKFFKYINSKISGYENRLIIAGKNYKLSNKERQKLVDIINNNTEEGKERINMYKNFSRNFIVNGNNVFYR